MTLTPTAVHETLDQRGLLEDSRKPGVYALRVRTPHAADAMAHAFREESEVVPADKTLSRLTAEDVAYVGASGNVYDRLQDHAEGDVRQTLFLRCFELVDVIDVWPSETPFESEYNRAAALSRDGFTVWSDGEVL